MSSQDPKTPSAPKKGIKRGKKTIILESEVRCSERLYSLNKGFKPSICLDRSCLGCGTKPPLISSSVVRDLGVNFCNMDPKKLIDEKLLTKPGAKKAISKPKTTRAKKNAGKAADAGVSFQDEDAPAEAKKSKKDAKAKVAEQKTAVDEAEGDVASSSKEPHQSQ